MKRLTSIILAVALTLTLSATPVFAAPQANTFSLDFVGQTEELLLPDGSQSKVFSYQRGDLRVAQVTEDNGQVTIIEFDDDGNVFVNGNNIVTTLSDSDTVDNSNSILQPFAASNWTSPSVTKRTAWVEGLTVSAIAIIIAGLCPSAAGAVAIRLAGTVAGTGVKALYYKGTTSYNYVDYAPKVGYRLTEELYTDSAYRNRIYTRSMSGSR